jgi:hypothetical protein
MKATATITMSAWNRRRRTKASILAKKRAAGMLAERPCDGTGVCVRNAGRRARGSPMKKPPEGGFQVSSTFGWHKASCPV